MKTKFHNVIVLCLCTMLILSACSALPAGTVKGNLVDNTGKPSQDISLQLLQITAQEGDNLSLTVTEHKATTDEKGDFTFNNVDNGKYVVLVLNVSFTLGGQAPSVEQMLIRDNNDNVLIFTISGSNGVNLGKIMSSQQTNAGVGAMGTSATPTLSIKQYASAPPMLIDVNKQYFATVKMAKGSEFVIQLYPDKAPITVNSFVFLAQKGFFNGTTFHRVLEGFMAQGGDPTGSGMGGPGYEFVNEKNDLAFDKAGVVAMANAGPDTNGSQFFITFGPVGLSENDYTIFGQVISGMDVVNGLTRRDPDQNPTFSGDAMESITITEK